MQMEKQTRVHFHLLFLRLHVILNHALRLHLLLEYVNTEKHMEMQTRLLFSHLNFVGRCKKANGNAHAFAFPSAFRVRLASVHNFLCPPRVCKSGLSQHHIVLGVRGLPAQTNT